MALRMDEDEQGTSEVQRHAIEEVPTLRAKDLQVFSVDVYLPHASASPSHDPAQGKENW